MRFLGGLQLLLMLRVLPVPAQDPRLTARFPAAVAARLDLAIDSARREGLPTDPLVLRALEGQAKGASTEQIIDAVARLHAALHTSRATLGAGVSPADVTVGAAALQAGVPELRLQELHQLRGRLPIATPLSAYLDLVARGAPAEATWARIEDLARHRAPDADFTHLTPGDVDHGASHGPPTSATPTQGPR